MLGLQSRASEGGETRLGRTSGRKESHLEQVLFPIVALHLGTQDGSTGAQGECQAQEGLRLAPAQAQGADLDHGVPLRLREDACRESMQGT